MIHHRSRAILMTAGYLILSLAYILISGRFAEMLAPNVMELAHIEKIKGILFVVFSAVFLFWFASWQLKSVAREATDLLDHRDALLASERKVIVATTVTAGAYVIKNHLKTARLAFESLRELCPDAALNENVLKVRDVLDSLSADMQQIRDSGMKEIAGPARRIDLCALLESSIEIAQLHASVRRCHVNFTGCKTLEVFLYPALIHSMLLALLLNASEAAGEGGTVEVHVRDDSDGVTIEVHDSGPGIAAEKRGLVFSPFFSTKEQATGLGLLSVHACAEAHMGRVEVFNSPLGGARFDVILPGSVRV